MKFKCEQCGQCCGPVPFTREMYERFKDKAVREHNLVPWPLQPNMYLAIGEEGYCCFLTEDFKCNIYNNRPLICRQYGIDPEMPCIKQNPKAAKKKINEQLKDIKVALEPTQLDSTMATLKKDT